MVKGVKGFQKRHKHSEEVKKKIGDAKVYIQDEGDDIASISIENQFVMDTDYEAFWFLHSTVQNKVLDWCYQISKTPLEERD